MYQVCTVSVLGSDMEVFIFTPEMPGSYPGLVLAQHLPVGHTGLENDAFTLETAQRLANNGYLVAVPFIFHWWPKSEGMEKKKAESRDDWMVADIQAAFRVLSEHDEVENNNIALVGHCWGGRVAWLAACHLPELKALAVFYGGNIKKAMGEGNVAPIELANNIQCPMIGFFGDDDGNPSVQDVEDYHQALDKAEVKHDFYQYAGAGHAFQNFTVAERYNQKASDAAWVKLLAFLKTNLG